MSAPNAAMLSSGGRLTDIGLWYLGENGTGVPPDSGSPASHSRELRLSRLVRGGGLGGHGCCRSLEEAETAVAADTALDPVEATGE